MPRFLAAAILAVCSILFISSSPAEAKRLRSVKVHPVTDCFTDRGYGTCGGAGAGQWYEGALHPAKAIKQRKRSKAEPIGDYDEARKGGSRLVSIQCGPLTIRVASTAAVQFAGFCRDLYAGYKFTAVGGWRAGKCWTGGKHPCGGAIDISQSCRSRGPGHCLPRDFPVARSEQLARVWGLKAGSEWGHRDVGHFETRGSLAGVGWKQNAPVLASIEEPAPKHWPVTLPVTPKTEQLAERIIPQDASLAFSVYSEYGEPKRDVVQLLSALKHQPVESPKAEIVRAASLFALPVEMLNSFAKIESDFDPKNRTGSYKGLFQLSDAEFNRYGGGDIYNARDNAVTAAHKFAVESVNFEHTFGRKPSFDDLYLIHQQGWEGAAEHVTQPNRIAWRSMCATEEGKTKGERWCRKAIWGNVPATFKRIAGSVEKLTSGAFVDFWRERVLRLAQGLSAEPEARVKVAHARKAKHRYAKRHRNKHYASAS